MTKRCEYLSPKEEMHMAKHSKKKKHAKTALEKPTITPVKILLWDKHPNGTALVILFALLFVFFYNVLVGGRMLLPPDALASRSIQPFVQDALKRGVYPLWNPYIFSGMPSFASLMSAPYVDILNWIIKGIIWVFSVGFINSDTHFSRIFVNYFLLGGLVYLLLRSKKLSPGASLYSSLAMVFMPQVIAYAAFGHNTKLQTAVFIPLVFLLVDRLLEKRNLLFFSAAGLAMGLQLLRAHIQICFYTELMILVYFIYWTVITVREKKISKVIQGGALLLGAVIMGLLISSVLNLSVWEYSHYSIRGGGELGGVAYEYATNWSFSPSEIATFFIPSFMGFGGETYWGPMPFTDFPLYCGLVTLLFAGLALILNRNRMTKFFTILAVIVLFISFGKHLPVLYGPMFKFFPFFNKFRAPNMIHILFEFSVIVLAGFGLQGVMDYQAEKKDRVWITMKRYLTSFGGVVTFLFLILLLGKGVYLGWASKADMAKFAAYDKALSDGFKALVFFGLAAGAVVMVARRKMNPRWFPFVMVVLLLVDLWIVNRRFVHTRPIKDEKVYFAETPEVQYLKSQEGQFRILPVGDQRTPNWYMYHKIQSAWGYQGAKLRLYQELADAFNMPNGFLQKYLKVEKGQYTWKKFSEVSPGELAAHQIFLQLTNVRYIVTPYFLPDTTLQLVYAPKTRGANGVFEYRYALPRLFFPKEMIVAKGKEAILNYMASGSFDPSETAILEDKPPFQISPSDSNRAKITSYDIHRIEIDAEIKTPSLLVMSEMYYPAGWKAFVDGKEATVWKTDYALRSLFLEPGSHRVLLIFKPKTIETGFMLSVASLLLMTTGAVVGAVWMRRKKAFLTETQS